MQTETDRNLGFLASHSLSRISWTKQKLAAPWRLAPLQFQVEYGGSGLLDASCAHPETLAGSIRNSFFIYFFLIQHSNFTPSGGKMLSHEVEPAVDLSHIPAVSHGCQKSGSVPNIPA